MNLATSSLEQRMANLGLLGVKLWVEDGRLRFRAPKGVMTAELRAELGDNKAEIIEWLSSRSATPRSDPAPAQLETHPEHRYQPFPLTDIQQAYWIGRRDTFALGKVACQSYSESESETLDLERFQHSLHRLVERHDMLRMVVLPNGRQQILEEVVPYVIGVDDLRGLSDGEREARLTATRGRMAEAVSDPEVWPLFEIRASRLDDRRLRLHLRFDLLIADAWSFDILFREWYELYRDPDAELPELELSFRDCVLADQAYRRNASYERSRQYWHERLPTLPPGPELPLHRNPESLAQSRFVRLHRVIGKAAWSRLKERASTLGVTPSGLLLGVFSEVLGTWSKSSRFSLNLTFFNRPPVHPQITGIVGDFTSTIPFVVEVDGDQSFERRLAELQNRLWQDLEHSRVGGIEIMRELFRVQGGPTGGLLPVVFTSTLKGTREEPSRPRDWPGVPVYGISQTPQVWLDHQIKEEQGGLSFNWDIVAELFPEGLPQTLFDTYCGLLEELAESDRAWSAARPVSLPARQLAQRAEILAAAAVRPLPREILHGPVTRQAASHPERLAVIAPDRSLTYGQLWRSALKVGHWLRHHGARPNRLVAVVMEKGWEQVSGTLGVLCSGAAYLPIDAALPTERLHHLLERGGVELVLTQPGPLARLEWPEGVRCLSVDDASLADLPEADPTFGTSPEDLAYVIFTSGSTGTPKGVVIDHRGAVNTVLDINRRFALGTEDRVLALSALPFDLSVYDIFGVLGAGGTVVIPAANSQRDPEHWLDLLVRHEVTVWNSVPALMEMLAEFAAGAGRRLPETLRLVLLSGDWIPVDLPARIRALAGAPEIISLGGATEASIWSIFFAIGEVDPEWPSIPYGRPLDHQGVHVLRPDLSPCPTWVPGELYISGAGVALGYWRDPEKTAASFPTHPETGERIYRTGDWGRYLPSGDIEFLGREDLQVKIRGHRIELGEIEAVLLGHPGLRSAVVAAIGEPRGHRQLVGYVVAAGDADPDPEELRGYLGGKLPGYMVPELFVALDALPLSANGKVDRQALPQPAAVMAGTPQEPRTALEIRMVELWQEILGVERPGISDNFFQLGGNSLLAIELINRLREGFDVEIPLREVFEQPTASALAALVEGQKQDVPSMERLPTIDPDDARRHQPFPLTDIQQAYWMGRHAAFELGNVAAHFYSESENRIDPDRYQHAWRRLIDRHDMLRMVVDGDGRQRILQEVPPYEIARLDLRGRPAAEVEREINAIRKRMSHQVLPADRWPLFEIRATLLDDDRVRYHVSVDLLILDAWSAFLLSREFARLLRDPDVELPPLALSFRDYILALGQIEDSELYRRSKAYWWQRLDDLPEAPELPMIKAPSELSEPRFVRYRGQLDAGLWERIKQRGAESGLSPTGVVVAAFSTVLARWCRRSRFTLNLTTFNRLPLHPQVQEILGDFTSVTLLEVDVRQGERFADRARRFQRRLWEDLDHRYLSGVEVLRELARRRGRTAEAIMPVVLTSQLFGQTIRDGAATVAPQDPTVGTPGPAQSSDDEKRYSISQTPQVWLDHQVSESPAGELRWNWDAVDELFPEGLLDKIFEAYGGILERLAQAETWERWSRPRVPAEDLASRAAANATAMALPLAPLHEMVERQIAVRPQAPAVIGVERTLTFAELDRRSRRIAAWLVRHGARRNHLVAIVLEKSVAQVEAVLGVLRAGAAYLPIDPAVPAERLATLLDRGQAGLVLTRRRLLDTLDWPDGVTCLAVDDDTALAGLDELPAASRAELDDLAYVIFTSGSTGMPKGVMIDHRGAANTVIDINLRFAVEPRDRVLAVSALNFDLSVYDLFGPLAVGGALVVPAAGTERDPDHWLQCLTEHAVTLWNSVPALFEMLVEYLRGQGQTLPPALRLALLSGDWIALDLPDRARALGTGLEVVSLGGATEGSIWSIFHPVDEVATTWTSIPYGRPLANQEFHVLDAGFEPCPEWVPGELYIGGRGVALGYWRDGARTAASFVPHPESAGARLYRTGDWGRYLPSGDIEFLGREDLQVKIRGHRIELGEIESALAQHPDLSAAVVEAVGDPRGERRLVGYLVAADGRVPASDQLRDFLRRKLPEYMVPPSFVALEALPLSVNGKVDRKALPVPAEVTATLGYVAPRSASEERVALLWQRVLGADQVGLGDSLFELGGNSLTAIEILNRLREETGLDVALRALFEDPTVAGLAAALDRLRTELSEIQAAAPSLPQVVPDEAGRHQPFPLTEVQQAYWVGRQSVFELGDVAAHFYNEQEARDLDLERFTQAWRRLIDRHEMLRAIFLPDGRQQILAKVPPFEIEVLDLRGRPEGEAAAELRALRERMSHQVLPADRWPLFEIRATRLADDLIRLHMSFDLLILDAWSARILFEELRVLYADPRAELEPIGVSFRDYVVTIGQLEGTELFQRSQAYWQERLSALPPAPDLPLVRTPEELEAPRFVRRHGRLDAASWQRLRARGAQAGLSPTGVVAAAFCDVLARWSRKARFTLNVTTFNRLPLHSGVQSLIGDFTSLTLLAVNAASPASFERRARRIQEQLWADLDHRYISGVVLLRELARQQGRPASALMPVVLTSRLFGEASDAAPADRFRGSAVSGEEVYSVSQTPQVWLDHQVSEQHGELVWTWDSVDDLFPDGLLEKLFEAYRRRLEELATDEAAWQSSALARVPAADLARRAAANATATALPLQPLHEMVERQIAARPQAPAVIGAERTLTYAELDRRSERIAARLARHSARRNQLVAIVLEKSVAQVEAVLGVLRAGAAYLPIDPAAPAERLATLLERGQVELVLTRRRLLDTVDWPDGVTCLAVDDDALAGLGELPEAPRAELDDLAYVIFTSGSTGIPKGVMIDHRGAANTVLDINRRFAVGPGDRVLAVSALNFDLSVYDLFGPLAAGGALVVPAAGTERDPGHWLECLNEHAVTLWNSVPALFEMLVEYLRGQDGALPPALRLALLSGDWIPLDLPDRVRALGPGLEVVSLGGATEGSIWSIFHPVGEVAPRWKSIPYGRPLANQEFHVLDAAFEPCPEWVPGELYIGGRGVALGYWRDGARTAAAFVPHPEIEGARLYRTGDWGRYLPSRDIEFLGREDLQVKIRGHRIELGEIEAALAQHPDLSAAVVEAVGDPRGERRLVGYLVAANGQMPASDPLRDFLRRKLPEYMVPASFVALEALPLSANGKVDRKALPVPEEVTSTLGYVAPRTASEQRLAELWQRVLGADQVGISDSLFELGGNSLTAIEILNRVREETGLDVALRALFEDPTVAGLAVALDRLRAELPEGLAAAPSLPQVVADEAGRHQPFPLTEVQQAYWVGRQSVFELGDVAAHFYNELESRDLDLERLTRAWRRLIDRHEMLRAIFLPDGRQQILPEVPPFEIEVLDLRGRPEAEVAAELRALRARMSHQVLPADRWPLFEIRATRLADDLVRLHMSFDLLILDAWSARILFEELRLLYADPHAELEPIGVSFRDYVVTLGQLEDTELFQRSQAYWLGRLAVLPPAPDLPQIRTPEELEKPRFARRHGRLDAASWQRLRAHGAQAGVSPTAVVAAAFCDVLARWSRKARFTLNVTTFNRLPLHPGVQRLIGDFTSLTLLAVDAASPATFELRARQLQERLWADLDHRYLSGVRLLRELARQQGRPASALMPVVLTSRLFGDGEASETPPADRPEASEQEVYSVSQTPQVWLDHQVSEQHGELVWTWDSVDDLFPEGLLETMFEAYRGRLEELAAGEVAWQSMACARVPAADLARRAAANATATALPLEPLHELVEHQIAARPQAPAVIGVERTLSFAELGRRSRRIAAWLARHGARRGTLVAIVLEKSVAQVEAVLGVLQAGAAYLPIAPAVPAERLATLLERGQAELILTRRRLLDTLAWPAGTARLAVDDDAALAGLGELPETPRAELDDLAYVIFTSGSTGMPKGVMIDHRGAANTVLDINRRFAVGPGDRVLAVSALNFDLSVYDLFGPLAAGGALVVPAAGTERDPGHWQECLSEHAVTLWNSVPALFEMLVEYLRGQDGALPSTLRLALLSGDWIPLDLPDRARALGPGPEVVSLGGATEGSIWSIFHPVGEVAPWWKSIPYGRPLANQEFHVLDAAFEPCPEWVPGELYIGGRGVALGYWRDGARTAAAFVPHPEVEGARLYRTGDWGRYLPSGDIEFLGREDLQVKIRGHRIELGEIEAALIQHPDLSAAVVEAVGDPRGERRLVGYLVAADGRVPASDPLRDFLRQKLPEYMVPPSFVELEALPLSANGKVDRKALPVPEEVTKTLGYVAPRNAGEERLAELWQRVLGVDKVGISDSLFELGGNSLTAIEILNRVREETGLDVALRALFEEPTVAGLATALDRSRAELPEGQATAPGLPQVVSDEAGRHQPFPLTEVQQAYWVGRQSVFELGDVAAHFYNERESRDLDLERFTQAWRRLIDRHEMLRAIFLPDGRQQILPEVPPFEIEVLDLRGRPEAEVAAELRALRERMSHQVLPADRWPLFEIRATRLADDLIRLHMSFDLLILDAWSARILFEELRVLYADPHAELEPIGVSFRDYVLTLGQLEVTELFRRSQAYWLDRLAVLPPAPDLPQIRAPEELERPRFVRRHGRLDAASWQRLRARGAQAGVSPTGVVAAAFCDVLARWSRKARFTLNVTTFNRLPLHPGVQRLIGDFTSLTLLAVDAASPAAFELRARRLQEQLWVDLDHRYLSGVYLLRELGRRQGRPASALMPVVLTSRLFGDDNPEAPSERAGGAATSGQEVYSVSQTPQVWLDHQVSMQRGELVWTWDSVDDLFPDGLLETMFETYRQRLEELATDEAAWQSSALARAPAADLERRAAANATVTALPLAPLHELVEHQIAARPQAPAVIGVERTLSFGELGQRSRRIAAWLVRHGARRGTLVAIVLEKNVAQVEAALGVLQAGAAYLPIDPAVPAERLATLLERGQVELVLTRRRLLDTVDWPDGVTCLAVDDDAPLAGLGELPEAPRAELDDLAYVIFTSGSTGMPKGVMIDHRGAANTVLDINRRFAVGPGDRVLAVSALNFDLSVYDLFGLLAAGGALVVPAAGTERDPGHWQECLSEHAVTLWNSVPALFEMLVEYLRGQDGALPPALRLALLSGDWIPLDLPDRARALGTGLEVVSLGGATEGSIWSIFHPVGEVAPRWKSIPYGRPLANQEFHVLDAAFEPCPEWVPGELYIGGRGVALGYWRDGATTGAAFVPHPEVEGARLYRTGDWGRYLPSGDIEFLGREDLQVKIRGHRIELGEIEAALNQHPQIRQGVAQVVVPPGAPDDPGGQRRLVAYVLGEELAPPASSAPPDPSAPAVPGVDSSMPATRRITDPTAKLEFKLRRAGLRHDLQSHMRARLEAPPIDLALKRRYVEQRSRRAFLQRPLSLGELGAALDRLSPIQPPGLPLPKYRYPSGGGLYPVQTYLHIRPDRVAGLAGGFYYYEPVERRLEELRGGDLSIELQPPIHRGIAEESAFALMLVVKLGAIGPLYPETAWEFSLFEAACMAQLLMTPEAGDAGIGWCAIDGVSFDAIRPHLELDDDHELAHVLLAGPVETVADGELDAVLTRPSEATAGLPASGSEAASASEPVPPSGWRRHSWQLVKDPTDRLEFKLRKLGLRRDESRPFVQLPVPELDEAVKWKYAGRRSYRDFQHRPISIARLGEALACLRALQHRGAPLPNYRFPSAGALYPVQAYLCVKPDRVAGLDGGSYYYHPEEHALVQLSDRLPLSFARDLRNGPIFEASAFSLFLVADHAAIGPLYGEIERDFCILESGCMSQLLMTDGPASGIGYCSIGGIDCSESPDAVDILWLPASANPSISPRTATVLAELHNRFRLGESHEILHLLLGGGVEELRAETLDQALAPDPVPSLRTASAAPAPPSQISAPAPARVSLDAEEILGFLHSKLPEYMVPSKVVALDTLPLTANGKVDRKALPNPFVEAQTREPDVFIAPESELESTIAVVWSENLGAAKISTRSNFFELGGDSISMLRVHLQLQEALGREIAIVDLFTHPSIRDLARHLSASPKETTGDQDAEQRQEWAQKRRASRGARRGRRRGRDRRR